MYTLCRQIKGKWQPTASTDDVEFVKYMDQRWPGTYLIVVGL